MPYFALIIMFYHVKIACYQTRRNGNDSHPRVSSKPLIEEEEPNPTITPKSAYKCICFNNIKYSGVF